jgi:hypothetical protein
MPVTLTPTTPLPVQSNLGLSFEQRPTQHCPTGDFLGEKKEA